MKPFRVGIIGSGFMGATHAKAVVSVSSVQLVAIAGGRRASGLARDFHVEMEASPEALIQRQDIDAVVLATPHYVHAEHGLLALRSEKHVLVEKPLATSLEDCDALIDSARQSGCSLAVGFHQRFRNNNKLARSLLQSGALGDVQAAQVSMISSMDPLLADTSFEGSWDWSLDPRSIGDILNTGPHAFDLLRWLLGSEIHAVAALCRTFRPSAKVEDTTVALLALENGAVCNFISSSIAPGPAFPGEQFRFRLIGSKAVVDLDPYGKLRLSSGGEFRTVAVHGTVDQQSAALLDSVRMQAFCDQMDAFAAMIEGKLSDIGSGEDGRTAVALSLALLEASRSSRTVDMLAQK